MEAGNTLQDWQKLWVKVETLEADDIYLLVIRKFSFELFKWWQIYGFLHVVVQIPENFPIRIFHKYSVSLTFWQSWVEGWKYRALTWSVPPAHRSGEPFFEAATIYWNITIYNLPESILLHETTHSLVHPGLIIGSSKSGFRLILNCRLGAGLLLVNFVVDDCWLVLLILLVLWTLCCRWLERIEGLILNPIKLTIETELDFSMRYNTWWTRLF